MQLCLEICDLEEARFIQYRPAMWPMPEEFKITEVKRDRQWFADALPTLWVVHQRIQAARAEARASGFIPYEPRPVQPRRRSPPACIVVDDLYGPFVPPAEEPEPPDSPCMFQENPTCMFVECLFR